MAALQVGLIGAGVLGGLHAQGLSTIPGCRLTSVLRHDGSDETASLAQRFDAQTTDLAGMLEPGAVDAVVVATPTDTHLAVVRRLIDAGIPVFCEKPLARTTADAEAIRDHAEAQGVKVAVGHVVRYFPEYAAARQAVRAGELGTPASARLTRLNAAPSGADGWYADPARSGGVLLDMAIHDVDWCLWTLGPVARVFAVRAGDPDREVASITLRHSDGTIAYVEVSWREDAFSTQLELWGSEGFYEVAGSTSAGLDLLLGGQGPAGYLPSPALAPALDDPFRLELVAAMAWFAGGPPPLATAADGAAVLRVMEAAEHSAATGQPVALIEAGIA